MPYESPPVATPSCVHSRDVASFSVPSSGERVPRILALTPTQSHDVQVSAACMSRGVQHGWPPSESVASHRHLADAWLLQTCRRPTCLLLGHAAVMLGCSLLSVLAVHPCTAALMTHQTTETYSWKNRRAGLGRHSAAASRCRASRSRCLCPRTCMRKYPLSPSHCVSSRHECSQGAAVAKRQASCLKVPRDELK